MRELAVSMLLERKVPVGTLVEDARRVYWEFDPEFLASGRQISAYNLPAKPGLHEHSVKPGVPIPGVFSDSRPDGWGLKLLHQQFASTGRAPSEVSALDELAYLGERAMGALVYEPSTAASSLHEAVELGALAKHAQQVYSGAISEVLPALVRAGGSPGGARPKALIGRRGEDTCIGEAGLPDGYEPWLVKFERPEDDEDCALRELAWMRVAAEAGLDVPDVEVIELGTSRAFAIKRFDRAPRQHLLSAAGALGVDFRTAVTDYTALGRLTGLICSGDARQLEALLRLACFNVVMANDDDHLKNIAWLSDGSAWRLAPAYDLTYAPAAHRSTLVGGHSSQVPRSALVKLGEGFGLPSRRVQAVLAEVVAAAERVPEMLRELGCTHAVSKRAAAEVGERVRSYGRGV